MNILFLISLAHGAVITVLLRRFYHIFFTDCRVSVRTEWLLYGLTLTVSMVASFFVNGQYFLNFLINISIKYFLTLIYPGSHKKRICLTLLFMLAVFVVEIVLLLLMMPVDIDPHHLGQFYLFHSVGPLFSAIFMYVFVFIVEGVKSTKTGIHFSLKYWICFIATPLLTFFLMETVMLIPSASTATIGICSLLMLLLNFSSFYFYEIVVSYITNKMEKDIAEEKNLYYTKQLETQTAMLDSLRSYQHDLKNHAIAADAYFFNEEYDKLRDYYHKLMRRPLLENKEYQSGNTIVDSLLNYKAFEAKKKGVTLNVKIAVPPTLSIPASNLAIILGNLLDNAITAAASTEEKTVKFKLTYANGCLMMKMENPYIGKVIKTGGRFLSTKENAILHGYGLRNVKRLVDENGGTLKFNSEDQIFTVTLLLYDIEKEISQE